MIGKRSIRVCSADELALKVAGAKLRRWLHSWRRRSSLFGGKELI